MKLTLIWQSFAQVRMIHFPLWRKYFLFAKLFLLFPPWLQWKTRITFPVCVTIWSKQNSKIKSELLQSHDFVVRCKIWRSKSLVERHLMFSECSCCTATTCFYCWRGKEKNKTFLFWVNDENKVPSVLTFTLPSQIDVLPGISVVMGKMSHF